MRNYILRIFLLCFRVGSFGSLANTEIRLKITAVLNRNKHCNELIYNAGENVVIVSPDSDNLSVLTAALSDENPDDALKIHYKYGFQPGDVKPLHPLVKPPSLLYTGQTQDEADENNRKWQYARALGASKSVRDSVDGAERYSWLDLWHISVDEDM